MCVFVKRVDWKIRESANILKDGLTAVIRQKTIKSLDCQERQSSKSLSLELHLSKTAMAFAVRRSASA